METKLTYNDIAIVPEEQTLIEHRGDINPYDADGFLPIFASCMSTVVSMDNSSKFNYAKIKTVIPRTYSIAERIDYLVLAKYNFVAFSLQEAEDVFVENKYNLMSILSFKRRMKYKTFNICIDLANGHMKKLLDVVKNIKKIWGDRVIVMTGNIANPKTYLLYEEAGVDYVRCSIGSGHCCTTSANTGVFYPQFSLIKEIYELKKQNNCKCKIIADGGIHIYRDIQKALIYADYVMIGSLFNKAIESAGKTTYGKSYWIFNGHKILKPFTTLFTYGKTIKNKNFEKLFETKIKTGQLEVWKNNFGMSTKVAQTEINKVNGNETTKLKTAEGKVERQKVEYTIKGWAENETDFLRSAMSYTNSRTLEEFKESQYVEVKQLAHNN